MIFLFLCAFSYHWFLAIICFPGMEGYHDYNSLEALPNFKRTRTTNNSNKSSASASNNNKKPIVYNQPKSETTSSYSSRDEAPEDSEEMEQSKLEIYIHKGRARVRRKKKLVINL